MMVEPAALESRRTRRAAGFFFLALMLSAGAGFSGGARQDLEPILVSVKSAEGAYELDSSFNVRVSSAKAWEVLSDYEHIGEFVPFIKESVVEGRGNGHVYVRQLAVGKFWFFSRNIAILLDVEERSPESIIFQDIAYRDFESYHGYWKIDALDPNECLVHYHLTVNPSFAMPPFASKGLFRSNIQDLVDQVRAEMLHR